MAAAVRGWRLGLAEDRLDDLRLLTSELVTNALAGSGAACAVCVRWTGARVRVEVTDASRQRPRAQAPGAEDESGRGLLLVEALAVAWGTEPHPAGKVVWFEIEPHPAGASARVPANGAEPVLPGRISRPLRATA